MSSLTVINGIYGDEELLKRGAKSLRAKGFRIREVFSPFPIHGIDQIIGLPRTRIAICSFIYGLTGALLGTWMMWYMMVDDWPNNIGGKPNWYYYLNVPAFIPITFECTVLCAAHGMVLTFFIRSWLLPGVTPKNPDPRTTDDKFLVQVEVNKNDISGVEKILKETGAEEVKIKV